MSGAELAFAGLARQAELVRRREVSAREVVESCLERIERLDGKLNAFRVVRAEAAIAEAEQIDHENGSGEHGSLRGVPVAIKDNVDVAGEVTARGTAAHGAPAALDAKVVRRLRAAGAVIIGKTNLPELSAWPFTESPAWGVTRNPWDLSRIPGGSSGGSAVAVAAGLAGAALGSDGGGSIRVPAAACGLFGLKPQRGRVPFGTGGESWYGLDTLGPLTRTVLDSALFYDAVMGPAGAEAGPPPPARPFAEAAARSPGRLRIAWSLEGPLPLRLGDEVRSAVETTAALLARLGHRVERRRIRYRLAILAFATRYLAGVEAEAALLAHPGRVERRTRSIVRLGHLCRPLVPLSRRWEPIYTRRLNRVLADCDVLVTPVVPRAPFEVERFRGAGALRTLAGIAWAWPICTPPWNLTGQPAASVPAGFDSAGLPLAVQLVGRPNEEPTLLSLAAQLEAERPWADRRPPEAE